MATMKDMVEILFQAAETGDIDKIKELVKNGANIHIQAESKYTLLHKAAEDGQVEVFVYLTGLGLDPTAKVSFNDNTLHIACSHGRYAMVKHIVNTYPDIKNTVGCDENTALHYCAESGSIEIFDFLISQGLDVHSVNSKGDTVLHKACFLGKLEMVKHIVTMHSKLLKTVNQRNETPLHESAKYGNVDVFKLLVNQGLSASDLTSHGETVLHCASNCGKYEMVKYLLDSYPDMKAIVARNKETALHTCADNFPSQTSVEVLKLLIDRGLDAYSLTADGKNVLHVAVSATLGGKLDMVKYLATNYPDLTTAKTKAEQTPLDVATDKNHEEIISYLKEKMATMKSQDMLKTLFEAVKKGDIDKIKELVKNGANIHIQDESKYTLLHKAAEDGKVEVFVYLTGLGLDPTAKVSFNDNTLHIACSHGRYALVKHIVNTYPDIKNTVGSGQATALHHCIKNGSIEIFDFLISQGLDVQSVNATGDTVLHEACIVGNLEMVKHIVTMHSTLLQKVNHWNETPLHGSARHGNMDVFKLLVNQGLSASDLTSHGETVLHCASSYGQYEMVKYLLDSYPDMKAIVARNKETALHSCADNFPSDTSVEVLKLLIDRGLDAYSLTADGKNVLHLAVSATWGDTLNMVKYLATNYPNLATSKSKTGKTPLDVATDKNHEEVISYLKEQMAILKSESQEPKVQSKTVVKLTESSRPNTPFPFYPMVHNPRGWCVIINNMEFSNDPGAARKGSDIDEECLANVFENLYFQVQRHRNLTYLEMAKQLKDFAEIVDHSNFDCFVCCILSHGSEGSVFCSDSKDFKIKDVTEIFQPDKCPSLSGKPKLFFVQACQGESRQIGSEVVTDHMAVDPGKESVPSEADCLIGYATVPGYVSYRDIKKGSWYIQELCRMLDTYGTSEDLVSILVQVNNEVSRKDAKGVYKQMPAPFVTLRKKVLFRPLK